MFYKEILKSCKFKISLNLIHILQKSYTNTYFIDHLKISVCANVIIRYRLNIVIWITRFKYQVLKMKDKDYSFNPSIYI